MFGLDCAVGERWSRFARDGDLPTAQDILREGACAPNCLAPLPTLTSTNWTTLATGAWPGTHGITDFNIHKPGQALNDCPQAFDSSDCEAEYIWNAAARAGKRSIVVNYPASWPSRLTDGVQVGGAGCEVTDWRIGLPAEDRKVSLAAEQLFSTEGEALSNAVVWPAGSPATFDLELAFNDALWPISGELTLRAEVDQQGDEPVLVITAAGNSAVLRAGAWSDTFACELSAGGQTRVAVFRLKLLELDPSRRLLRLFVTDLCSIDSLQHPESVVGDVSTLRGLPLASVGFDAFTLGWIDLNTMVELHEINTEWLADVSIRLMTEHRWDLYYIHMHAVDWFYHAGSVALNPRLNPDQAVRQAYEAAELRIYQAMDSAMGRILDAVEAPRLTVVVSDHGATSFTKLAPTAQILRDAGLLSLKPEAEDELEGGYTAPVVEVDWAATRAIPQRSCWVYVNLEGRDPDGAVPQDEYGSVQEQIIDALLSYRDPDTGLCPYSMVLRKQDARVLGLHGDRIGDVVYAVREEFSDEHGQILGTGRSSDFGSLECTLAFQGPGVARGVSLERTVWLTDVVPTICHIARLPIPHDSEGSVIHQMLERPDGLIEDLARAQDQLARLATAVQRRQALTHQPPLH